MKIIENRHEPKPKLTFKDLSLNDCFHLPGFCNIICIKVGDAIDNGGVTIENLAYCISDAKLLKFNRHDEVIKLEDCEFHFKRSQ